MIAAFDVQYGADSRAWAAAVLFESYADAEPTATCTRLLPEPQAAYIPGAFYRRELPCLLALLEGLRPPPHEMIVDGYVTLGDKAGLGRHLFDAVGRRIPVIGVAKNRFEGAPGLAVLRGGSRRPLFITAVGMPLSEAGAKIKGMHGPHRVPTLLKRVDGLAREKGQP